MSEINEKNTNSTVKEPKPIHTNEIVVKQIDEPTPEPKPFTFHYDRKQVLKKIKEQQTMKKAENNPITESPGKKKTNEPNQVLTQEEPSQTMAPNMTETKTEVSVEQESFTEDPTEMEKPTRPIIEKLKGLLSIERNEY